MVNLSFIRETKFSTFSMDFIDPIELMENLDFINST